MLFTPKCIVQRPVSIFSDFMTHRCVGAANKKKMATKKRKIQKAFFRKMGLNIDMPRDSGHGTSNDGNTARRFYERPDIVSKILDVPAELVWGIGEIWHTLTSGRFIDTDLFGEFCQNWLEFYKTSSISWYLLSPTIHKVLEHGVQIIENLPLPIGWYSEEPSGMNLINLIFDTI